MFYERRKSPFIFLYSEWGSKDQQCFGSGLGILTSSVRIWEGKKDPFGIFYKNYLLEFLPEELEASRGKKYITLFDKEKTIFFSI
jgi:hypothetical protein